LLSIGPVGKLRPAARSDRRTVCISRDFFVLFSAAGDEDSLIPVLVDVPVGGVVSAGVLVVAPGEVDGVPQVLLRVTGRLIFGDGSFFAFFRRGSL